MISWYRQSLETLAPNEHPCWTHVRTLLTLISDPVRESINYSMLNVIFIFLLGLDENSHS